MKTVRFNSHGDPAEVLAVEDAEMPVPGPGEVRVRMLASPINPADLMFVRGSYGKRPALPATPGFEGVGVVEDGRGLLARFLKGKRVSVLNRERGNWSEHTIVRAKQAIPLDKSLSVEQAACFFVNPATAYAMTRSVLKVPNGEWLLQSAAGSALGRMVVRLGQHYGFRTLNIVRRESQVQQLKSLGGDEVLVFDGDEDSFVEAVREIIPGGAKYAIDAVGGTTGSAIVRSLGFGARMLVYGTLSGEPLSFSSRTLMTTAARLDGFWLSNHMSGLYLPAKLGMVRNIAHLAKSGVLTSDITQVFELSDIQTAVVAADSPGRSGKVVLQIGRD